MSTQTTRGVTVDMLAAVRIEVRDEEAITRCFESDWWGAFYRLRDRQAVLNHWAYNAVANGVTDACRLEGWGDLEPGVVTMRVESVESA